MIQCNARQMLQLQDQLVTPQQLALSFALPVDATLESPSVRPSGCNRKRRDVTGGWGGRGQRLGLVSYCVALESDRCNCQHGPL